MDHSGLSEAMKIIIAKTHNKPPFVGAKVEIFGFMKDKSMTAGLYTNEITPRFIFIAILFLLDYRNYFIRG
jgi:hypothetical protein